MIATTTTSNTENMGRTAREMVEVQRDSYEAFTENLAAAQRRSLELANGGATVREAAGGQRQGCPGVVRGRREALGAPEAQRPIRAGLDERGRRGRA